jgi:uncharacterized membrane protein
MFKKTLSLLVSYFFRGLIVVTPIIVTVYLFYHTITWLDNLVGVKIPGLGFLISLTGITLIGFFGTGLITKPIFDIFDNLMDKTPGVKFIYSSVKDMLEAFVGDKKKFTEPVLVEMTTSGIMKIGFVTKTDLSDLGSDKNLKDYVGVYFPHSYNFSGNLFIVPKSKLVVLKGKNSDLMKMVVSGGVTESILKAGKEEESEA